MATGGAPSAAPVPRDALGVAGVLRSMGVEEWEPRVLNQMMEFVHRYTADVLVDATAYAEHAGRGPGAAVTLDDVKLAVQARLQSSFLQPPARESLAELATPLNSIPLPPVQSRPGVALPVEDALLAPNFQVAPARPPPPASKADPAKASVAAPAAAALPDPSAAPPTEKDAAAPPVAFALGAAKPPAATN